MENITIKTEPLDGYPDPVYDTEHCGLAGSDGSLRNDQHNNSGRCSPHIHNSDGYSPHVHNSGRYSPHIHNSDGYSPHINNSGRYSPHIHNSDGYSPHINNSDGYSAQVHNSGRYSPHTHNSDGYSAQVHNSGRYSPHTHNSDGYSAQVHNSGRCSPHTHNSDGYSAEVHNSGRYSPHIHNSDRYSPRIHNNDGYSPQEHTPHHIKQEIESDPEDSKHGDGDQEDAGVHDNRQFHVPVKEEENPGNALYDRYSTQNGTTFCGPVTNYMSSSFMCLWPTCKRTFGTNEALLQHVVLHEKPSSRQCYTCDKVFLSRKGLERHMEMHQNGFTHFCNKRKCEKGFRTEQELLLHNEMHKVPFCKLCDKSFTSTSHLSQHMIIHNSELIPCMKNGCPKTFRKNSSLVLHMRSHEHDDEEHICPECGRPFASAKKLKQHLRSTHGSTTRFMCPVDGCERGFKVKDSLRKHLISHSDEKSQKCLACGNTFKFDHTLRNHKRTNSMLDEYKCDIGGCSELFAMGCALRQHRISQHNFSSDVPCSSCGVVLPSKKELFAHRRIYHHKDPCPKTIKCDRKDCDSMFSSVTSRNKHLRTIHAERREKSEDSPPKPIFFCDGCGVTCKSQESLTEHVADQTAWSGYTCSIGLCKRTFTMKCIYERHRLLYHSKNPLANPTDPQKPFACAHEGCSKQFKNAKCCKSHITVAHRPDYAKSTLNCPIDYCARTFKFKYDLEEHIHNHRRSNRNELVDPPTKQNLDHSVVTRENPVETTESENPEFSTTREEEVTEELPTIEKPIVCPVCSKKFNKLKSIRRHLQCMHYLKTSLTCTFEGCGESFKSVLLFKDHRKNKCRSVLVCEETGCDMPLARVTSYECEKLARKADGETETFLCPDCGKSFASKSSYHRHKRVKHRSLGRTYTCDVDGCGKIFYVREYFSKHRRSHVLERQSCRVQCDHPGCAKYYSSPHSLKRHKRRHTQTQPHANHKCPIESCSAAFVWKSALNEHMAMHAGAFDCSVCDKRINSKYSLKLHMARHSSEPKLPCQEEGCKKMFHHEKELQRHMKYHIGNKRHICPVPGCNTRFYYPSQIPAHVSTHRAGKRYECPKSGCTEVLLSVADRNRHRRTHGKRGEHKTFPCTEPGCRSEFRTNYGRNRHLRNIHFVGTPDTTQHFRCPIQGCDAIYTQLTDCLLHIGTKHPDAQVEPIEGDCEAEYDPRNTDDSNEEGVEDESESLMDEEEEEEEQGGEDGEEGATVPMSADAADPDETSDSVSEVSPNIAIKQEILDQHDPHSYDGGHGDCGPEDHDRDRHGDIHRDRDAECDRDMDTDESHDLGSGGGHGGPRKPEEEGSFSAGHSIRTILDYKDETSDHGDTTDTPADSSFTFDSSVRIKQESMIFASETD